MLSSVFTAIAATSAHHQPPLLPSAAIRLNFAVKPASGGTPIRLKQQSVMHAARRGERRPSPLNAARDSEPTDCSPSALFDAAVDRPTAAATANAPRFMNR